MQQTFLLFLLRFLARKEGGSSLTFNYLPIIVRCDCEAIPVSFGAGITSLGEMCFFWMCNKCKQNVIYRIPMETLIADIPPHPLELGFTVRDISELAAMNITLPREQKMLEGPP